MRSETAKAFSLVEVIIIVMFLGVFAAMAAPRFNFAITSKQKAESTAKKIAASLWRARRLAISDAVNNPAGYTLNMLGTSPYTGYTIENLGTSTTVDSHTIDSSVSCTGGDTFTFGPLGNLQAGSDRQLTVSASGKTFMIAVAAATGTVKCEEN
ncbi:MAG: type II secretion system protein [Phycisphaerales bacterium]|jgi:Tfp pilus assembly protein FimT